MLNFTITKQVLSLASDYVVADTIKYLTAQFSFSSDWDGYQKIMHLSDGNNVYDFLISNDKITSNDNFSLTAGKWEIYLHGIKGDSRITTSSVFLNVKPFGNVPGVVYPNIPQSGLDRLLLVIKWNGDGTKYLADDGQYRALSISEEVIAEEIEKYLEEHPISVPTNVSAFTNDAGYITSADVPTSLAELTEDATHRVVTDAEKTAWNGKSNFDGNYNSLTNKPTIPTVPTNVSSFTNDSGYLTLATLPKYEGSVV